MYDSRVHKNKTIYIVMEEFNMLNFIRRNAKILAIIVILFFAFNTTAFATDINMNLPVEENTTEETEGTNMNVEDANAVAEGEQDANQITDLTDAGTTEEPVQNDIGGTAAPSGVSSIAQENMSFSNILNILVITVGVILILLAIAILIRLRG